MSTLKLINEFNSFQTSQQTTPLPKTESQKTHQHKHEKKRKSQNHERESVQFVNERKGSKHSKEKSSSVAVEAEEDSDNEKFTIAPLLKETSKQRAFQADGVEESIDDTDTEADESKNSLAKVIPKN